MLPVVLYDPAYRARFFPMADFVPLWELRTGALKSRTRWQKVFEGHDVLLLPPAGFEEVAAALSPKSKVLTEDQLPDDAIFVNSALIPGPDFDAEKVAEQGSNPFCKHLTMGAFKELTDTPIQNLDLDGEGDSFHVLRKPWEVVRHLETFIRWDRRFFRRYSQDFDCEGPKENLHIAASAKVASNVVIDTSAGPVVIDDQVQVKPFSYLVGPLYVGKKTIVLGSKLSASSFGEDCRVNGEVFGTVLQDCVNKAHDGFIGHSYVGHFVNFGAMTTNSNLKNTYGPVRLRTPDSTMDTGMNKFGMLCGPHTKFGIGSLIPTGSLIGGFCNLFAGGNFLPKHTEHFRWYDGIQMDMYRFDQAVRTAEKMAERRNRNFSAAETRAALNVYRRVYKP